MQNKVQLLDSPRENDDITEKSECGLPESNPLSKRLNDPIVLKFVDEVDEAAAKCVGRRGSLAGPKIVLKEKKEKKNITSQV